MDPSVEAALRILGDIRREGIPTGPVELSDAYLATHEETLRDLMKIEG